MIIPQSTNDYTLEHLENQWFYLWASDLNAAIWLVNSRLLMHAVAMTKV